MTADMSDEPQALMPTPGESVSVAGAGAKPYRGPGGARGRQNSRPGAKFSPANTLGAILPEPVVQEPVVPEPSIEEPAGHTSDAEFANPEPATIDLIPGEPVMFAPATIEPVTIEPVPEIPVLDSSGSESLAPQSEVPQALAAEPVPSADQSVAEVSPAESDLPAAVPESVPIPVAAAAAAPVPAVEGPCPTVPSGATPKPTYHHKSLEIAMTTTKDLLSHGQANVEAVVKSGQIWASGVQDITRSLAESAQAQFDHTVGTWKALSSTKSLKEAFDIQSSRARTALEKAVADGSKLTDASLKLAEQAFAPITARITVASESFSKPA